jgi:hypothetical protein
VICGREKGVIMTLLWIILAFITLCGIVAVCGKWFVYAITTMAAVIWTPIQETYRLHKGGEKKKARALGWSFGFAVAMCGILIALLVAMPK